MKTRMRSMTAMLLALCLVAATVLIVRRSSATGTATADNSSFIPYVSRPLPLIVIPQGQGFSQVTTITHAGDERLFVGQRTGEIFAVAPDGSQTMFLDLSQRVDSNGSEHGLYDVAFHPDYATNGLAFVTYSSRIDGRVYLILGRFRIRQGATSVDPESEAGILRIRQDSDLHKGGGLDFDKRNNWLYMGIGDDTQIALAQNAASPKGKVIRIAVDDVPVDLTGNAEGRARIDMWGLGFRNPWRVDADEPTGLVYVADVGSGSWEEVNVAPTADAGLNFGWPCREGAFYFIPGNDVPACHTNITLKDPVFAFSHEEGRCAIIGGSVYRPTTNPTDGRYIFGDLCSRSLFALSTGSTAADPMTPLGVVSAHALLTLGEDNLGNIYAGDSSTSGPIYFLAMP